MCLRRFSVRILYDLNFRSTTVWSWNSDCEYQLVLHYKTRTYMKLCAVQMQQCWRRMRCYACVKCFRLMSSWSMLSMIARWPCAKRCNSGDGWLKFNVSFQHKYGYIRDERGLIVLTEIILLLADRIWVDDCLGPLNSSGFDFWWATRHLFLVSAHLSRPAEYRWRPLFNATKFRWRPLIECCAVTLPRRETHWH